MNDFMNIKKDVLRYLGYKGQTIDDELNEMIDQSIEMVDNMEDRRYIYNLFEIHKDSNIKLKNTNFVLKGNSIKKHLDKSEKVILLAATIGLDIERKIKYYENINMTKSLILDACASVFIERFCDDISNELEYKYGNITNRFSPGYGDLSIDIQKDFLNLLDAERRIGITASEHNILIPRKSVTALIGLTDEKVRKNNCKDCDKYDSCQYRRD